MYYKTRWKEIIFSIGFFGKICSHTEKHIFCTYNMLFIWHVLCLWGLASCTLFAYGSMEYENKACVIWIEHDYLHESFLWLHMILAQDYHVLCFHIVTWTVSIVAMMIIRYSLLLLEQWTWMLQITRINSLILIWYKFIWILYVDGPPQHYTFYEG